LLATVPASLAQKACTPTGPELCFNATDDNCNGIIDEGCGLRTGLVQFAIAWDEPKADVARLAAAYGFGIVRDHPFNDGNKRAGFLAVGLFLSLNGYAFIADPAEAVEAIFALASGGLGENELAAWVRTHIVPTK